MIRRERMVRKALKFILEDPLSNKAERDLAKGILSDMDGNQDHYDSGPVSLPAFGKLVEAMQNASS